MDKQEEINNQTESNDAHAELLGKLTAMNARLASNDASAYAYNKINNLLLMQVLAHLENRDLEEIRSNVERYIAQFTDEFTNKTS
jgi:hypothetical protein